MSENEQEQFKHKRATNEEILQRIQAARLLMRQGYRSQEIVTALIKQYQLSERRAWGILAEAKKSLHMSFESLREDVLIDMDRLEEVY
jgi:hypothetical protein